MAKKQKKKTNTTEKNILNILMKGIHARQILIAKTLDLLTLETTYRTLYQKTTIIACHIIQCEHHNELFCHVLCLRLPFFQPSKIKLEIGDLSFITHYLLVYSYILVKAYRLKLLKLNMLCIIMI